MRIAQTSKKSVEEIEKKVEIRLNWKAQSKVERFSSWPFGLVFSGSRGQDDGGQPLGDRGLFFSDPAVKMAEVKPQDYVVFSSRAPVQWSYQDFPAIVCIYYSPEVIDKIAASLSVPRNNRE